MKGRENSNRLAGLERMLRDAARRVGARSSLLIDMDGRLLANVGDVDAYRANRYARAVPDAAQGYFSQADDAVLAVFVDVDERIDARVRLYARRIGSRRLLLTVFDPEDAAPAHVGAQPARPLGRDRAFASAVESPTTTYRLTPAPTPR